MKLTQYGHLMVYPEPDLTGTPTAVLGKLAGARLKKIPADKSVVKAFIEKHLQYVSPNRCAVLEFVSVPGAKGHRVNVDSGAMTGYVDYLANADQFR